MKELENIKKVVKSVVRENKNISIRFELPPYNMIYLEQKDTHSYLVNVDVIIETQSSERLRFSLDVLKFPISSGIFSYKIDGRYVQILDVYEKSKGWYILKTKPDDMGKGARRIKDEYGFYLEFHSTTNKLLKFQYTKSGIKVIYNNKTENRDKVPLGVFLKALSGYDTMELLGILGNSKHILLSTQNLPSTLTCVDTCIEHFGLKGINKEKQPKGSNRISAFREKFLSPNNMGVNSASRFRLKNSISFAKRALNETLAEDLPVDLEGFTEEEKKAGKILTAEFLKRLDKTNLDTLYIYKNDKKMCLKKYSYLEDRLTLNEYFTMLNVYLNQLDGSNNVDDPYELNNRVSLSIERYALNKLSDNLYAICDIIENNYINMISGQTLLSLVQQDMNAYGNSIKVDSIIEYMRDPSMAENQNKDDTNLLATLAKSEKITVNYKGRAPADMLAVHAYQKGRLDPFDTPESIKIGMVHFKTMCSFTDDNDFMFTPFVPVRNGEIQHDEVVYLSVNEEQYSYIADWSEKLDKDKVKVYFNGSIVYVSKDKVDYIQYSPLQDLSLSHGLVTFVGHSAPKRQTMGGNFGKQSIQMIKSYAPYVCTGVESMLKDGIFRAKDILAKYYKENEEALDCTEEEFCKLPLTFFDFKQQMGSRVYYFKVNCKGTICMPTMSLIFMQKTMVDSVVSYNLNTQQKVYQGDDIVLYHSSINIDKVDTELCIDYGHQKINAEDFSNYRLALGYPFKVAFKTYLSTTQDDALCIRKGLAYNGDLSSFFMKRVSVKLRHSASECEEFGFHEENKLDYIMPDGLPKVGTILKPGDVVIKKFCRKKKILPNVNGVEGDGKDFDVVIQDSSEILRGLDKGEVIYSEMLEGGSEAVVILGLINDLEVGDKWSGRHGNKGVVARLIDDADMPYIKSTGELLDIVLNPLGIPSRMNLSQVIEARLGRAMQVAGKVAVVSPYHPNGLEFAKEQSKKYGVDDEILVDGRTGLDFPRPVAVGCLYMYKLEHIAKRKIKGECLSKNLASTTFQGKRGKYNGAQKFSEMETWCLSSAGAPHVLQEIMSLTDDIGTRDTVVKAINSNPYSLNLITENHNEYMVNIWTRLQGTNLINQKDGSFALVPLTDKEVRSYSTVPVTDYNSLESEALFGRNHVLKSKDKARKMWSYIELGAEIIHPFWIEGGASSFIIVEDVTKNGKETKEGKKDLIKYRDLSPISVEEIMNAHVAIVKVEDDYAEEIGKPFIKYRVLRNFGNDLPANALTGMEAVVTLFKSYTLDDFLLFYDSIIVKYIDEDGNLISDSASKLKELQALQKQKSSVENWKKNNLELKDLVISTFPVIPIIFRPEIGLNNRKNDYNEFYSHLLNHVIQYKDTKSKSKVPEMYAQIKGFTLLDSKENGDFMTLSEIFAGKGRDSHGKFREECLGKRVVNSGRSVISPAEDYTMDMNHAGLPFILGCEMYTPFIRSVLYKKPELIGDLDKDTEMDRLIKMVALNDFTEFRKIMGYSKYLVKEARRNFKDIKKVIVDYLETRAILLGRQPSLWEFSIRAFQVKVVDTRSIQIHPLSAAGYNADYDGDTMYAIGLVTDEAVKEALEKLTVARNIINPKDSSLMVQHSQDMVLGMYCATMLHNNVYHIKEDDRYKNIYRVSTVEELTMLVQERLVSVHDLVSLEKDGYNYLSTAGRVLFNSIFKDGFSDKPFANVLDVEGVKPELYRDLKYDGVLAMNAKHRPRKASDIKGLGDRVIQETIKIKDKDGKDVETIKEKVKPYSLTYVSISDILQEVELEDVLYVFQKMMEFGFLQSDLGAVTISMNDFECSIDVGKANSQALKYGDKINTLFLKGLISDESRKRLLINYYSTYTNKLQEKVIDSIKRNNNLYIISDSGARGKDSEIMQAVGVIGIMAKNLQELLETPLLSNYFHGLDSMDNFQASFSGRWGFASTQYGTAEAGYASRKCINITGGITIIEEDCGNNQLLETKYGNPCRLFLDGKLLEVPSISSELYDAKLVKCDENKEVFKLLAGMLKSNNILNNGMIDVLFKHKIRDIVTTRGKFTIHYKLDSCFEDLLTMRQTFAYDGNKYLPYLDEDKCMTKETIKYIEDAQLERIPVRIALTCKSVDGVCMKCYGKHFKTGKFPEIKSFVGFSSSQSATHSMTQMSLSYLNFIGKGKSVTNGVSMVDGLFTSGTFPTKEARAIISGHNGYILIENLGKNAQISIFENLLDFSNNDYDARLFTTTVLADDICVRNGEYVKVGQPLTYGVEDPQTIKVEFTEGMDTSLKQLNAIHLVRMFKLLESYYLVFSSNGIHVHARHFELIVRSQAGTVTILSSDKSELQSGFNYDINYINSVLEDDKDCKFIYNDKIPPISTVIDYYSGTPTALCFERCKSILQNTVMNQRFRKGYSPIGSLLIGENVATHETKIIDRCIRDKTENKVPLELQTSNDVDDFVAVEIERKTSAPNKATKNDLLGKLRGGRKSNKKLQNSPTKIDEKEYNNKDIQVDTKSKKMDIFNK